MKDFISKTIFILFDIATIALSIYLASMLRGTFDTLTLHNIPLKPYLGFYLLYIIPILLFAYECIYTYRYDFWHESRLALKGIIFSGILILAYLTMTQMIVEYSLFVIGFSFFNMALLIPLSKNISKKILHKLGLWQKKGRIYGNDPFPTDEIYGNPYLGYVKPKGQEEPSTKVKDDKPSEKILFKQKRLGKNGTPFSYNRFQTMYENSAVRLEEYLQTYPEALAYYETYHKFKNDPRVTKACNFLRRTSLDELPHIFNVFREDMSFKDPRRYMLYEKDEIGKDIKTILSVKPVITGLWQVSGRSGVDFFSRIELDVWYIRNWNLWMDMDILIKTIKTVLLKDGAK